MCTVDTQSCMLVKMYGNLWLLVIWGKGTVQLAYNRS